MALSGPGRINRDGIDLLTKYIANEKSHQATKVPKLSLKQYSRVLELLDFSRWN